jgi:hypothetical protein
MLQITIIGNDEFTGCEVEVVVNDATSMGIPSVQKCSEMLEQQQARYRTLLTYKSHTVKTW